MPHHPWLTSLRILYPLCTRTQAALPASNKEGTSLRRRARSQPPPSSQYLQIQQPSESTIKPALWGMKSPLQAERTSHTEGMGGLRVYRILPVLRATLRATKSKITITAIFPAKGHIARKFHRKSAILAWNSQNQIAIASNRHWHLWIATFLCLRVCRKSKRFPARGGNSQS